MDSSAGPDPRGEGMTGHLPEGQVPMNAGRIFTITPDKNGLACIRLGGRLVFLIIDGWQEAQTREVKA